MRVKQGLLIVFAMAVISADAAHAQSWPNRPVRFIVPAQAGTAPDIISRLLSDKLTAIWNQQVVVENRGGGAGIPGMIAVAKAAPDGYTLGASSTTTLALTPSLMKEAQYNLDTDFVAVAKIAAGPMMMAVTPNLAVSSVADVIALAKSQPGKLNLALSNLNNVPHLSAEMFQSAAGIKFFPVAFGGSNASITAAVSGEAQIIFDGVAPLGPQVRSGRLKPIAVTSLERMPGYENVPTVHETIPGFQATGWFALMAPAGTPVAVVEKINRDLNTVLAIPEVVSRIVLTGNYPTPGTPKAAAEFIQSERALWARVIREAGIKQQ